MAAPSWGIVDDIVVHERGQVEELDRRGQPIDSAGFGGSSEARADDEQGWPQELSGRLGGCHGGLP